MLRMILAFVIGACFFLGLAFGQAEIGGATLNGTVTDPSGAALPNAKVTVTSLQTGLTRTTTTNQTGLYSIPQLPVGTYDLTVEANGFKLSKRTGVSLTVGAVATVD